MISRTTETFRQHLAALPVFAQNQAQEAYRIFRDNPSHPGLRFKKVWSNPPIYSVRIGLGYRALGAHSGEAIVWFWIGSHAEYDRWLERM